MRFIHLDKADAMSAPTDVGSRIHWILFFARIACGSTDRYLRVNATASRLLVGAAAVPRGELGLGLGLIIDIFVVRVP